VSNYAVEQTAGSHALAWAATAYAECAWVLWTEGNWKLARRHRPVRMFSLLTLNRASLC
jgi:hypothetical protein